MAQRSIPQAGRPLMPKDYGVPEGNEGLLAWSYVEERMKDSPNYWIATVRPDGRPHTTPVWGVWLDGVLYFDGSPETRRSKNLLANPNMSVHLEDGWKAVILEGRARYISEGPGRQAAESLVEEYSRKYAGFGYEPKVDQWDRGGLFAFDPVVVMAWTQFFGDATRWEFKETGAP